MLLAMLVPVLIQEVSIRKQWKNSSPAFIMEQK